MSVIKIFQITLGDTRPLDVQFSDAFSDTFISLSGASNLTATAKHTVSGTVVSIPSVTVSSASLGKIRLVPAEVTFGGETGVWDIQIKLQDAGGFLLTLPSEAGQLKLKVNPSNV